MKFCENAFLLGVIASLALGTPALGQTLDTSPTDDDRTERKNSANITQETAPAGKTLDRGSQLDLSDSFQPKGVDLGSFVLFPVLEIGESYNSNFYASETNEEYDLSTALSPSFYLNSNFNRHSLSVLGDFEYLFNARHPDDNQFNSNVNVHGVYDVDKDNDLVANISHAYSHEDRGSADDAGGDKPTPTMTTGVDLGSKHKFGKNILEPQLSVTRSVFYDVDTSSGVSINNDDRDRTKVGVSLTYSRELFPGYAWVLKTGADTIRYDTKRDDFGFNRSSVGGEVLTGVGIELTNVMRGDVLVGYMARDYEDGNLNDPMGMAVQASIHWTPSKLTIISPSISRGMNETTLSNAASITSTTAAVTARHELARNTVVGSTASYSYREFDGIGRQDNIYEITGQVTHAFTPETYLRLDAGFKKRDSNARDSSYDQGVVSLTLGLRM